jgi:hypothetical protein
MGGPANPGKKNTFTDVLLVLYFQRYPGQDPKSGIANVPYKIMDGSKQIDSGKTDSEGRVFIGFKPKVGITVEILGSKFPITNLTKIPSISTTKGLQRRLKITGYYSGRVDGVYGPRTERAMLNFQADHDPLKMDGSPGNSTNSKLKDEVGG